MEMDADGNVIPKTPQAAIMAATAYLAAHPPPEGDPKRAMHKSALTGLGLVGAALHQEAPTEPKKKAPVRFDRSPTPSSEEEDHDLPRRNTWHPAKPLLENRVKFVHCIVIIMHCLPKLFSQARFVFLKRPILIQTQNPGPPDYFVVGYVLQNGAFSN